jgi:hypothetical protein
MTEIKWAQDTAGMPWHHIVDSHRNSLDTACGTMLVNSQVHSVSFPNDGSICSACVIAMDDL